MEKLVIAMYRLRPIQRLRTKVGDEITYDGTLITSIEMEYDNQRPCRVVMMVITGDVKLGCKTALGVARTTNLCITVVCCQFRSDEYFNFTALAALAAKNSLCGVIRSTEQHRSEVVYELFSGQ